jgi:hypothetical protein
MATLKSDFSVRDANGRIGWIDKQRRHFVRCKIMLNGWLLEAAATAFASDHVVVAHLLIVREANGHIGGIAGHLVADESGQDESIRSIIIHGPFEHE